MIKEEMFKVEINQMTGTSSLDIVYGNVYPIFRKSWSSDTVWH